MTFPALLWLCSLTDDTVVLNCLSYVHVNYRESERGKGREREETQREGRRK